MRRISRLLCLILSVSFALAPLSTLHAHVGPDSDDSALHGGHVHHGDEDQSGSPADSVIDVQFAAADRSFSAFSWTTWLPLIFSLAAIWLSLPYLTGILRPPTAAARLPRTRTYYWQPPLRGPPAFPINVR